MDSTLSQILDTLYGLNNQVTQLKAQIEADAQQIATLTAERDAALAEIEALRPASSPDLTLVSGITSR